MIIGVILLVIAIAELFLGLRFIFGYEKRQATIWYGLFCIAVATYVGANGLGFITDSWFIGERIGWVGGMLTAILFLPFSFSFPIPMRQVRELFPWVIWPIVIFVPGLLFTDLFVRDNAVIRYSQGYETAEGPYFWFMLVIFSLYWFWSIINLFTRFRRSDGLHRWQIRMIITGIVLSLIVSVIFDIVTPLVTINRVGYIGSLFTSVWLGFTSYILVRK